MQTPGNESPLGTEVPAASAQDDVQAEVQSAIGRSIPRLDAIEKVTGRARYTGDLKFPGMLHARLLRSPVAHATIRSIDTREAAAVPGVVAVLTVADFHDFDPVYGRMVKDRPLLADGKVRFVGEPVAAVLAENRRAADEAVQLIDVDYDELPHVETVDEAVADGAPVVHEHAPDNVCFQDDYEWGDVVAAAREADEVFIDTFTFQKVHHYAMEPHTAIAHVTEDEIRIWASTQHAYVTQREVAKQFGVPIQSVRVEVPYLGGAFGGKSYKIEPLVVALSKAVKRPVKLEQSVEEAFYTDCRHAARCTLRTGVRRDGTLVFREAELHFDTGAYAEVGPRVIVLASHRVLGPYRWPHVKVKSVALYTNTTPAGSFRAIGAPQTIWACESQMDMIAERLGLDPVQFRLKNLAHRDEAFRPGMLPLDADVRESIERAVETLRANDAPDGQPTNGSASVSSLGARNRGIAVGVKSGGSEPISVATIRLFPNGRALLLVSTAEMGQGAQTALAQICAETLSISPTDVQVAIPDTSITSYDQLTGASRSTVLVGAAVRNAALDLREQLTDIAGDLFDTPKEEIQFAAGRVITPKGQGSLADLFAHFFGRPEGELVGRGYSRPHKGQTPGLRDTGSFWEISCGAAEIELDEDTGEIRIPRFVSVADVGKAINPEICRGQDEGAAVQAVGHTLYEEMIYQGGQLLNPNLVDYRVPLFSNVPAEFETILIENEDGPGPFGSKGVGEAGIMCVAPAVANAVANLTGVRLRDLPLTPERVWRALREARDDDEKGQG